MRDQFGLNDMNSDSFTDTTSVSSRFDKERERQSRAQLAAQLQGLPEPEYTYEIAIPKGVDEMEVEGAMMVEDAAEVAEARREERERLESEELERRSTVLKRNLPRPSDITAEASRIISQSSLDSKATPELELASSMINKEMVRILKHDDYKYPNKFKDKKRSSARPTAVQLEIIDDQDMEAARELIIREAEASIVIDVQAIEEEGEDKIEIRYKRLAQEYSLIWEENQKNKMFLPSRGERGSYGVSENKIELLTALATQFAALKARIDKDSKSAQKLESHLQVTTQGEYSFVLVI
jgi:pre-mRNA-splicing factor CDC5/CEF1